ncbi:MAG TPA: outer membrane beta-barrel protein [Hyphomicrobiaceae bacterium]|nr:outer membrane beta-barrel protein [Hyphomicrobiaceae bacterium]
MTIFSTLRRAGLAAAAALAIGAPGGASAQNYDGSGIVRFGLFGQGTWVGSALVEENDTVAPPVLIARGSGDISGLGVGLSIGYDWRMHGNWIFGVEGDWTYVGAESRWRTTTVTADYTGTLRARLGVYTHPHMLWYATGGLAMLGLEGEHTATTRDTASTRFGWTIGAGTEINWHHVILFGEYLYADYEEWSFGVPANNITVDTDAHMFRLGIKFKVGHDHYHDDVRHGRPMK